MTFFLAAASGLLLSLSFPGASWSLLALVAFVPLFLALSGRGRAPVPPRRAFALGYVAGFVFFLSLLHWIPRLPKENVTIPYAMIPALFLIAAYLALFPALSAAVSAVLARRGIPVGLTFPIVWTLLEVARGTGLFGFPWGSVGYALAPIPQLIQFASWTGLWGVTAWILFVNGFAHGALVSRAPRRRAVWGGLGLLGIGLPLVHGLLVLGAHEPEPGVRVGLVQPNVGKDKWQLAVRDSVIDALLEHTRAAARSAETPEIIVWPETAIPARLPREPRIEHRVNMLVDSLGIPLLAGFPDGLPIEGKWRFTNSAGLILPGEGMVERCDKRHLVPFSEHFPLPLLNRVDFGQSNFTPGREAVVFERYGPPFGVLICFESIFPGPARELTGKGARYLINITNDQWFGDSPAPYQHLEMNVLRCIENRIGMGRAANTGVSAILDPYGRIVARTPSFVTTRLDGQVELRKDLTLYTRWGDWIVIVLAAGLLGLTGAAFRPRPSS